MIDPNFNISPNVANSYTKQLAIQTLSSVIILMAADDLTEEQFKELTKTAHSLWFSGKGSPFSVIPAEAEVSAKLDVDWRCPECKTRHEGSVRVCECGFEK